MRYVPVFCLSLFSARGDRGNDKAACVLGETHRPSTTQRRQPQRAVRPPQQLPGRTLLGISSET
jgi:hypothetical protein